MKISQSSSYQICGLSWIIKRGYDSRNLYTERENFYRYTIPLDNYLHFLSLKRGSQWGQTLALMPLWVCIICHHWGQPSKFSINTKNKVLHGYICRLTCILRTRTRVTRYNERLILCQLEWDMWYPDMWPSTVLVMSIQVFRVRQTFEQVDTPPCLLAVGPFNQQLVGKR